MGLKSREKESRPIKLPAAEKERKWNFTVYLDFIKRSRWGFLIVLSCFFVICLCQAYLRSTVPISFSAQLSNAGNARFSYATKQSDTYSPACGCMADKAERWRGITFVGRHFRLTNPTQGTQTAYWLMAAEPGPLDWMPGLFRPQVKLRRLLVKDGKILDLSELQTDQGNGVELISEEMFAEDDDAVALVTNKPVDIRLPDDFPIAAYIPVEKSTVSIVQPSVTFQTEWNPTLIREEYQPTNIEGRENNLSTDDFAYPMIDFVGPTLILTTDDEQAALVSPTRRTVLQTPSLRPGWRSINVIIVRSPFSTRVSLMPLGQDFTNAEKDSQQPEEYQKFEKPDRSPLRPLGPNEKLGTIGGGPVLLPTAVEQRGQGSVEVAILERLNSIEYARLRDSLKKDDKIWAHDLRSRAPELDHHGMQFRYPLIPPLDGFNVFGLLKDITLNVNSGHLMLGASSIAIDAPSVLEMRNIRAYTPSGNVMPIPIVGNTTEQSLGFSMYATSELLINKIPVGVRVDQWRVTVQVTSYIAMLIGAISCLLNIWHFIRPLRKK